VPTYTYQCKKCAAIADHFHGINAKPRIKCEDCGGACKRLLGTGSGIIFKGTGFYETDFKSKSGKPAESDSNGKSESKTDSAKTDSTKTESKTSSSGDSTSSSKKESKGKTN
jgi:putative FmdB family regulatory protein